MTTATHVTVKQKFNGLFTQEHYDGSYHDARGYRTEASEEACASFVALTDGAIIWTQVHGHLKDPVKRAMFTPYPHWTELYDAVRAVIRAHSDLGRDWWGPVTGARIMGDAMTVLREKHGFKVPKWWLPVMSTLRGR
jgi:hypothetical protein